MTILLPKPECQAQKYFKVTGNPTYTTKDTVTDAGADTFYVNMLSFRNSVSFQVNVTNMTGDVSTSTVLIQASIDQVNFFTIDTITLVNTTNVQSYSYLVNEGYGNPFQTYRVVFIGDGTQTSSWQSFLLYR